MSQVEAGRYRRARQRNMNNKENPCSIQGYVLLAISMVMMTRSRTVETCRGTTYSKPYFNCSGFCACAVHGDDADDGYDDENDGDLCLSLSGGAERRVAPATAIDHHP